MLNRRRILTVLLLGALAAGGFFAGRQLLAGGASQAKQPSLFGQIEAAQTAAATGERFQGELLGITIASSMDRLPASAQAQQQSMRDAGCTRITMEEARGLDFPRPLVMPAGYTAFEDEDSGATACGGKASGIGRDFATRGPADTPGNVFVGRGTTRYEVLDVAATRVSVRSIGGRDAVVVGPVTPDGLAQQSEVLFPEPFGMTVVYGFSISEEQLLPVAEAVAEASR